MPQHKYRTGHTMQGKTHLLSIYIKIKKYRSMPPNWWRYMNKSIIKEQFIDIIQTTINMFYIYSQSNCYTTHHKVHKQNENQKYVQSDSLTVKFPH